MRRDGHRRWLIARAVVALAAVARRRPAYDGRARRMARLRRLAARPPRRRARRASASTSTVCAVQWIAARRRFARAARRDRRRRGPAFLRSRRASTGRALVAAAWQALRGHGRRGASTITMQLAALIEPAASDRTAVAVAWPASRADARRLAHRADLDASRRSSRPISTCSASAASCRASAPRRPRSVRQGAVGTRRGGEPGAREPARRPERRACAGRSARLRARRAARCAARLRGADGIDRPRTRRGRPRRRPCRRLRRSLRSNSCAVPASA